MGEVQDDDGECDLSKKCNKKTQCQINVGAKYVLFK